MYNIQEINACSYGNKCIKYVNSYDFFVKVITKIKINYKDILS